MNASAANNSNTHDRRQEFCRELATGEARNWFQSVKHDLRRQLEELERYESAFEARLLSGEHADAVRQVEWAVNQMQQTDFKFPVAIRAAARMAAAFNVEL